MPCRNCNKTKVNPRQSNFVYYYFNNDIQNRKETYIIAVLYIEAIRIFCDSAQSLDI